MLWSLPSIRGKTVSLCRRWRAAARHVRAAVFSCMPLLSVYDYLTTCSLSIPRVSCFATARLMVSTLNCNLILLTQDILNHRVPLTGRKTKEEGRDSQVLALRLGSFSQNLGQQTNKLWEHALVDRQIPGTCWPANRLLDEY